MNKNIKQVKIFIFVYLLLELLYAGPVITVIDTDHVGIDGYNRVELCDNIYTTGERGLDHGHAGTWCGVVKNNDYEYHNWDKVLRQGMNYSDNGTSGPKVTYYVGSFEHTGSSYAYGDSSISAERGGMRFNNRPVLVKWDFAFYDDSEGDLKKLIRNGTYEAEEAIRDFAFNEDGHGIYRGNGCGRVDGGDVTGDDRGKMFDAVSEMSYHADEYSYSSLNMAVHHGMAVHF